MDIRKCYLSMIKAFPGGWDAIVGALGMTRDGLENRIYERKGQGLLVETALQMQKFSDTTFFAEAVATASGGTFVRLPSDISTDNEELNKKFHALYQKLGTFSQHFSEATVDDEITPREQADLKEIGDDMQRTISELLALTFRVYCPVIASKTDAGAPR